MRIVIAITGASGVIYTQRLLDQMRTDEEDSERLSQAITPVSRVVVVGAGWIGSEVAASARQMGAEVVLIERGRLPLERVLGPEVGAVYRDLHTSHGVEFLSAQARGRSAAPKFDATSATIAGMISAAPTPSSTDQPTISTGRLCAIAVMNDPHP